MSGFTCPGGHCLGCRLQFGHVDSFFSFFSPFSFRAIVDVPFIIAVETPIPTPTATWPASRITIDEVFIYFESFLSVSIVRCWICLRFKSSSSISREFFSRYALVSFAISSSSSGVAEKMRANIDMLFCPPQYLLTVDQRRCVDQQLIVVNVPVLLFHFPEQAQVLFDCLR